MIDCGNQVLLGHIATWQMSTGQFIVNSALMIKKTQME